MPVLEVPRAAEETQAAPVGEGWGGVPPGVGHHCHTSVLIWVFRACPQPRELAMRTSRPPSLACERAVISLLVCVENSPPCPLTYLRAFTKAVTHKGPAS